MLFGLIGEKRSLENPSTSLYSESVWNGLFSASSVTGETVTEDSALGVTAIWQAVNVISGTIASLPAHLYRRNGEVTGKDSANPLYYVLHDRPNENLTAHAFYKWLITRLLLSGRATAYIARDKAKRVRGLYPLDGNKLKINQSVSPDGVPTLTYAYDIGGRRVTYAAADVIDLVWFPEADAIGHRNPIQTERNAIASMIAAEKFAAKLFANGGVPPLVLSSSATPSPEAAARAVAAFSNAVKASANVMFAPAGHTLEAIGFDPAKSQLVELRQFQIGEACRIFNIAPAILHDLTHGTYSNVEQQSLSFYQQTLHPLVEMVEQEMNAKLFGARNSVNYFEFNMSGLVRGDLATRMTALAKAVNSALMSPNEARSLENLPPMEGGDELYIQGATVPISQAGQKPVTEPEPIADDQSESETE